MTTTNKALVGQVLSGTPAIASSDERRTIREVNFSNGSFNVFEMKNVEKPLGNHYHRNKSETFYFTKGSARIRTVPVSEENGQAEAVGQVEERTIRTGEFIHLPAMVAHTFIVEPDSAFICYSSAPFNEEDKDMLSFVIDMTAPLA